MNIVRIYTVGLLMFVCWSGFSQASAKVDFVQHLLEVGDYGIALGKINKALKKATVKETIMWKALQSEAYFKMMDFEKSKHLYKEAQKLYLAHDSLYESGIFLINSARFQSDHSFILSQMDAVCAKASQHSFWSIEARLLKASIMEEQGYENSVLKVVQDLQAPLRAKGADKQRFIGLCLKAKVLIRLSEYKKAASVMDTLKDMIGKQGLRGQPVVRNYHELKALYAEEALGDYVATAKSYEDAYAYDGILSTEYLKGKYLYHTILNFKKAHKEVSTQRFVREAEISAYQRVGLKNILVYDLSHAYLRHCEGDLDASNDYVEKLVARYPNLAFGHYVYPLLQQLKYQNLLQSGRLAEASSAMKRLVDSSGMDKKLPKYQKLKLELLKHEVLYGDDFASMEKIKRESYNNLLVNEIGQNSKENIDYLDLFSRGFKLLSRFDSSYHYSNLAYSYAIKLYSGKDIQYAYYTASMIQASLLAGVKIIYSAYLTQIESSSLKNVDKDSFMFINTLEKLSEIYTTLGDFDKAKEVLSLSHYISVQIIASPFSKANYQSDIGKLYLKIGRYSKAYELLEESIIITNEHFGVDNRFKYSILLALSDLYNTAGNFSASTEVLTQAKRICLQKYTENSLSYTEYLKAESKYYISIGDFGKAKLSLEKAMGIQKAILPSKSVELAGTMIELAYVSTYVALDQKAVIALYDQATAIIKDILGENIPLYADLLKRKGEYYSFIKEYEKSSAMLNQSLTYWNKLLGEKNTNSAEIFLSLGNNAYATNDYAKAADFYGKAYGIYNAKFSEKHPGSTLSAGKLARAYYMQRKYSDALSLMEKVIPIHLESKNEFFATMSFSEKSKFWNLIKDEFEFYNYLVVNKIDVYKEKVSSIYNNTLSTKALLLSNTLKIKRNIFNSGDSVLISKYNEWIQDKELLLYAHSQNKEQLDEQNIDIKSLESQIEELEKAISKKSQLFSNEEKARKYTWQNVAAVLGANEYVMEIVKVRKFNKVFLDSSLYLIMILDAKASAPQYVVLKDGKELDTKYLAYYKNAVKFNTEDKYTYQKYWKPIKEKIPDGATIYISPDGSYCQMNLEMAYNGKNFAIEENQFLYLTNSVDLATKHSAVQSNKNKELGRVVLCGDPEFYTNKVNSGAVATLNGTAKEVQEIEKIAHAHYKNQEILVLTNKEVIEDSIKKIKSPFIFHIATHGYFKETKTSADGEFRSNPLLNSGLLLGYSGDILESKDSYVNQKGGILTAYEVSNMDFDNTQLVVLSACETGKGEVQTGEGVMGLVRAFTIAGGKAIVNSLFKVNDEATVKFMTLFYTHFVEHNNEREAIIYAKKEMKKLFPQPINWGAFILYEAGR